MSDETKPKKVKIYLIALVIFLIGNFIFETLVTLLENKLQTWLYPTFPFSRIGLLIITILATNYYIRRRSGKPRQRLALRIMKYIVLILVFYGLTMGAIFAKDEAELQRLREERQSSTKSFSDLLESTDTQLDQSHIQE